MTFTDEELKIRKRRASTQPLSAQVQDFQNEDMLALIARLEAAEKLISLRGTHIPNALITREIETAVWAWRKAAGK